MCLFSESVRLSLLIPSVSYVGALFQQLLPAVITSCGLRFAEVFLDVPVSVLWSVAFVSGGGML